MLKINDLKIVKKKDSRVLIENFNFILHKGDKVAVIGEEGNGKSSLLKLIFDENLIEDYCYFSGTIDKENLKIGYLEQILNEDWNKEEVINFFLKENYNHDIDYNKYNDLEKVYNLFSKLNLRKDILENNRFINSLSGGEKIKIQLIKILISDPDVLLLDEPSNDIDIETLVWLEDFIKRSDKSIIYISHDETLLENTSNTIIHLEQIKKKSEPRHTICKMNYKDYVENRLNLINRQNSIANKEKKEFNEKMNRWRKIYQRVDHEQATISRQDPHGGYLLKKKMHAVKSLGRRLEKEKENLTEKVDTEDSINMFFNYKSNVPKNKIIYNETITPLMVNEKVLVNEVKLVIKGGEHVAVIGKNGCGKTTLIKQLYNKIKDGKYKVGYMPQNYDDKLNLDSKVVDFVCTIKDKETITLAKTYLGSMKFSEEEMEGKVRQLSGGQKAKLLLIKLILDKSDILVLDEPTRNLSPLSNPVIRKMLKEYEGCIISVSHDRKYISEVCDRVYELNESGLYEM